MITEVIKEYSINDESTELEHTGFTVEYNDGKTWFVPNNPANRHYKEIMNWVDEGNTITDPQA